MYRSILVPLDGSPFAEHALPLAASIARHSSAMLHLVHVHVATGSVDIDLMPHPDEAEQRVSVLAYLDDVAARISADGVIPITTALLDAPVSHALHSYAATHGVDLTVMTTHGRGALSRLWVGSVADRLMRQSTGPVLLVHPHDGAAEADSAPTFKHMLIPLDGSALAEQILPHALALGSLMQADYTLLQVTELALASTELYGSEFDSAVQERVRGRAQRYLDHLAAPLRAEGMNVRAEIAIGWPAQQILQYAHDHNIDAIALATHGHGGLARLLMGSVSDKVVRGATGPVLLYRPHEG
ncbi:MAG TPA: universal stress protein [Roseiflexaceae bacterium]|nr:universal stress protein [Roseiflexaceae bacterium]